MTFLGSIVALIVAPRLWWLALVDLVVHFAIDRGKSLVGRWGRCGRRIEWWRLGRRRVLQFPAERAGLGQGRRWRAGV